ncbi:unnamed protein product, partial [Porites evermanni]
LRRIDFLAIGNCNWLLCILLSIFNDGVARIFLFLSLFSILVLMAGLHIDYISQQKLKQDT